MTPRREPRAVVDGWLLEEFLGRGGNAEVWLASRGDTEHVALKILNQSNPRSEPYRRFRDEVSVLQRIGDHHGVLPLIDALIPDRPTNSRPAWLAMPRAEPLKERLGEEGDIRQIVSAIQSIAGTLTDLERAHAVYHRDLKPQK